MSFSLASITAVGVIGLTGVALYALLVSHNWIKMIIALQILLKAAVLALVVAGSLSGQINLGQSLAVTVIVIDTVVAVIGLALGVQIRRRFGTLDVRML